MLVSNDKYNELALLFILFFTRAHDLVKRLHSFGLNVFLVYASNKRISRKEFVFQVEKWPQQLKKSMKYFVDIILKECRNKLTILKISHVEIMNSLTVSRTNLNLSKGKQ